MLRTSLESKGCMCPFRSGNDLLGGRCKGKDCMAWVAPEEQNIIRREQLRELGSDVPHYIDATLPFNMEEWKLTEDGSSYVRKDLVGHCARMGAPSAVWEGM